MPRTPMVVRLTSGVYPPVPVDVAALDTFDNVNGMTFVPTGNEILVLYNNSGGDLTYTIISVNDDAGRPGDFGPHTIPNNGLSITGRWKRNAWAQASGVININASGVLKYILLQGDVG